LHNGGMQFNVKMHDARGRSMLNTRKNAQ
jgi:hypothetical protein